MRNPRPKAALLNQRLRVTGVHTGEGGRRDSLAALIVFRFGSFSDSPACPSPWLHLLSGVSLAPLCFVSPSFALPCPSREALGGNPRG